MKRILVIVICLVVDSSFASGQSDKTQIKSQIGDVQQELINLEKSWSEAYLKKDTATLTRIMADDIIII